MKRVLFIIALMLFAAPGTFAHQSLDHIEFGAFAH
jgi:hypothetical protein